MNILTTCVYTDVFRLNGVSQRDGISLTKTWEDNLLHAMAFVHDACDRYNLDYASLTSARTGELYAEFELADDDDARHEPDENIRWSIEQMFDAEMPW